MLKYLIKTFGCQMNYSDSERVSAVLETIGFKPAKTEKEADLILFNTCSIKQKAEDKVYGILPLIEQMKTRPPSHKASGGKYKILVGITGCMVKKTSTKFSAKPDKIVKNQSVVDFVFRIEDTARLPEILKEADPKIKLKAGNTLQHYFKINPKYTSKFQAFVPIATGCDKFCAYCVVPFTRGREKSRLMEDILKECEKLVKNGCIEITLLGQNVDSYGLSLLDRCEKRFAPLKPGEKIYFTRLLEEIDKLKKYGLARVRWTSPHPKDLTQDVINAVATLKTQMPYIHLPVQAGSNAMLKKMNRPYTRERYLELIKAIRKAIPDCAISTDLIVGFCGETEKMFKETLDLFKKAEWDMAYFAPYSMRKLTAAHRTMKDDVPQEEKERRWHKVNAILKVISLKKHKKFVGKTVQVLVERCSKGICEGRSEHYKRTQFPGTKDLIGKIVPVKVKKALEWNLVGEQK